MLFRKRPPIFCIQSLRFQNLYKPGEGLQTVQEVLNPETVKQAPATWKTHTMFGNPRDENLFHYSDRKAGSGYTNFRHRPYPSRPYIFPVAKKPIRNILVAMFVVVVCSLLDHDWIEYKIDKFFYKHFGYTVTSLKPVE